jgi:hypothetical protein
MRAALEALDRLGMADSITLTGEVYGRQMVTLSEASSVRRALRALEDRGQAVDMGRGFQHGRRMWATPDRAAEYQGRLARAGLTP